MNAMQQLSQAGQSLWLDNITRDILNDGSLAEHIKAYGLTGLTSNPSIFAKAISGSQAYKNDIQQKLANNLDNESLFIELALDDLRRAADLFAPAHQASDGADGWVSMEVSPLLADNTKGTIEAAEAIYKQGQRDNLFIKIPGTPAGVPAIEEAVYRGVPINVTLLFCKDQYLAVAKAYMRALERRAEEGLSLDVASVASLFVSRWDVAVKDKVPDNMHNQLGIAVAQEAYVAYLQVLASDRWQNLAAKGAKAQRMLWASTGTKDPKASDTLYVEALAAPNTINTLPDKTIAAFAEHGHAGEMMAKDDTAAQATLKAFGDAGIDIKALAKQLQQEGAKAFVESWHDLLASIDKQR